MLTYSRMAPYLRFTSSSPRIIRETTTGRARRAGLPRVRRRWEPDARTTVAQRDARPVSVGREGERREAHGHTVGHGARSGRRLQAIGRGTIHDRAALHLLSQLEQNPGGRLRMQERDAPAPGTAARHVVDEPVTRGPAALERSVEIGHPVADMVDSRAAPGEKLRHRTRGVAGLEQLDLRVAQGEADDRRAIGGFGTPRLEAQDVPVKGQGEGDARHGNADMGDACAGVRHLARQHNDCMRGSAGSCQIYIPWRSPTPRSALRSSNTRGSSSWISGRPGAVPATWWRPSWSSSPGSTRA